VLDHPGQFCDQASFVQDTIADMLELTVRTDLCSISQTGGWPPYEQYNLSRQSIHT
jgi:hypothetical protein